MKSLFIVAALAATALGAPAMADPVQIQGTATPTVHSSDPGLVLTSTPGTFDVSLDLDASTATPSSALVNNLFTLGTQEGSVEIGEDTVHYPLSVLFTFTNPFDTAGSPITGESHGFFDLSFPGIFGQCGLLGGQGGCGTAHFDGTQTFTFGDGGSFSVALNDVTFGTPGSQQVSGTFTLLTPSVPEPATWAMMLMGFGAMGVALRRSRKLAPLAQAA
jgi:opacity protein-like surface antigen